MEEKRKGEKRKGREEKSERRKGRKKKEKGNKRKGKQEKRRRVFLVLRPNPIMHFAPFVSTNFFPYFLNGSFLSVVAL